MSRPLPKEDSVEEILVRRVKALGGRCEKLRIIGRRGCPDRLVLLPGGRVIFCECKRPVGGRLSPHQISLHAIYKALGTVVAVVSNSADIDQLLKN